MIAIVALSKFQAGKFHDPWNKHKRDDIFPFQLFVSTTVLCEIEKICSIAFLLLLMLS